MLALPAQPSRFRQRLFHQRGGIDKHFDIGAGAPRQEARQLLELALDDVVIVAVPRICRNRPDLLFLEQIQGVKVRAIIDPEQNDRARTVPEFCRIGAPLQSAEAMPIVPNATDKARTFSFSTCCVVSAISSSGRSQLAAVTPPDA